MTFRPEQLAASLLALALASPALAQDRETAPDWTGLYFGAAVVSSQGDNTWVVESLDDHELIPGPWQGRSLAFTLGHDWQRGKLTFGGSLSLYTGDLMATPTSGTFFSCVECRTEISDLMTLRGRVGYATDNMLFFANGGYARSDALATNVDGAVTIADDSLDGWTLGVGVERRIGEAFTLALSYDHVDLGKLDLSDYLETTTSQVDFDQLQIGMNVRW
jgi:outer membrane immunogenic protein